MSWQDYVDGLLARKKERYEKEAKAGEAFAQSLGDIVKSKAPAPPSQLSVRFENFSKEGNPIPLLYNGLISFTDGQKGEFPIWVYCTMLWTSNDLMLDRAESIADNIGKVWGSWQVRSCLHLEESSEVFECVWTLKDFPKALRLHEHERYRDYSSHEKIKARGIVSHFDAWLVSCYKTRGDFQLLPASELLKRLLPKKPRRSITL